MEPTTRTNYALGAILVLALAGCGNEPFSQTKWKNKDTRGDVVDSVASILNAEKPPRKEVHAWLGPPTTTKDEYDRWSAELCGSWVKQFCTLTVYYHDGAVRKAQVDSE